MKYQSKVVPATVVANAECVLRVFNEEVGRRVGSRKADGSASPALRQIIGAMLARPEVSAEQWKTAVRNTVKAPPGFVDGPVGLGDVFGERAAERALANDGRPRRGNGNAGQVSALIDRLGGMDSSVPERPVQVW